MLAPMLAMVFWMAVDEPLPISIMAMTAATPMTMPSVVSAARIGLRRRARRAVATVCGRSSWRLLRPAAAGWPHRGPCGPPAVPS